MKRSFFVSNRYLNKNMLLLSFLLMLLGVIVPAISGMIGLNAWEKLYYILTNPFFNAMFYVCILLVVTSTFVKLSANYNYITRYRCYYALLSDHSKLLAKMTLELYAMSIILASVGAIIFSFGNMEVVSHPIYSTSITSYLAFFLIRAYFIHCSMSVIYYFIFVMLRRKITIVIMILFSFLFCILPTKETIISVFHSPILPHYYLLGTPYHLFILEIMCSIAYCMLLIILAKKLFEWASDKKRELV